MKKFRIETETNEIEVLDNIIYNKCGEIYNTPNDAPDNMLDHFWKDDIHSFNIHFGYGSNYDGLFMEFDLCEKCLMDFVDQFVIPHEGTFY